MTLPNIGITLGDPGGIGPEITLKALAGREIIPRAHYILFASRHIALHELQLLNLDWDDLLKHSPRSHLSLHDLETGPDNIEKGKPHKENGKASFLFFETAVKEAQKGTLNAVVTAPIAKSSWDLAGIKYAGHTEYLDKIYPRAIMSFWSEKLRVALFTHHLPLKEAPARIDRRSLLGFFLNLHETLMKIDHGGTKMLVSGLNPHAGEAGLLGSEETDIIGPAIDDARKHGLDIRGPFPPDVVFREALNHSDCMVIALYHDQGLIPFKLLAFDTGVNVTLGLPFIRTSPDHGTAFNLAGQGKADPRSMIEAIRLAYRFCTKSAGG